MATLGHCVHCNFELPKPVEFCPECGQRQVRLAKPRPLKAGTALSESFVIGDQLGEDGMSTTHAAEQGSLGRRVHLRTLHDGLDADPAVVKRFLAEVRKVGRLHHPASVQVLAAGLGADGVPWIATEDPGGRTLAARLAEKKKPVERGWAMAVLRQVCELLEQAHDEGIVHGGLDPTRVHVSERGEGKDAVKVTDLGVVSLIEQMARRADVKVKPSTLPAYLAPERTTNAPDARADIFALGVLANELLQASGPVPVGAAAAIEAATQPHPGDRPASPLKLIEMLEGALSIAPQPVRATGAAVLAGPEGNLQTVRMSAVSTPVAGGSPAAVVATAPTAPPPRAGKPARAIDEDELAIRGGARPSPLVLLGGGAAVGAVLAVVITLIATSGGKGDKRDRTDARDAKPTASAIAKADDGDDDSVARSAKTDDVDDPPETAESAAKGTDEPGSTAVAKADDSAAPETGAPPAATAAPAPSDADVKALADLKAAVGSGFLGAAHAASAKIGSASPLRESADGLLVKARLGALREAVGSGKPADGREHLAWLESHVAEDAPVALEVRKLASKLTALEEKEAAKLAAAAPAPAPAKAAKPDRPAKTTAKADKPAAKSTKPDKATKVARTDPDPATAASLVTRDPLAPKGVPKPLPKPAGIPTVKPKPKLGG